MTLTIVRVDELERGDWTVALSEEAAVVYLNFTDGLKVYAEAEVLRGLPVFAARMRSNHLEIGEWEKFLWSVPDDMLYRIATGKAIVFVDGGSRRADCIPRTIWFGLPLLLHTVLRYVWSTSMPVASMHLSQHIGKATAVNVDRACRRIAMELGKPLRARIRYWRRYATPTPSYKIVAVYGCAALEAEQARRLHEKVKGRI